jgi:DNA polymerase elongation subunit (family B)
MSKLKIVNDLASIDMLTRDAQTAFAVARRVEIRRNHKNEPFGDLELSDATACFKAKIWGSAAEALAAADKLLPGTPIKVMFELDVFQGTTQLNVKKLRAVGEQDAQDGYDPTRLFGAAHAIVRELQCQSLVVDIETVPTVDLREAPATIAQKVTQAAAQREYDEAKVMGLSPFFGQVVSLAVGDGDKDPSVMPVTVFVVPPRGHEGDKLPPWIHAVSEKELLEAFWSLAGLADTVVTFNGLRFDIPYLIARSVILGVPARVDLMGRGFRPHCDLLAVLTQDSRNLNPANLEIVCWALGIESPKGEMDGAMVAPAYQAGEIEKIATYNAADVRATAAVYQRVRDMVLRFRTG